MKNKAILILSAAVILMFCALGLFARPMPADEYGFYHAVANNGFIQSQISSYTGWTGRIFNTFLMYSCASFPLEYIQPFLPFVNVITYILAVFALIGTLCPRLKPQTKLSLSFLACALTLCFTFSLNETFYWMPGMPYFWAGTMIILALALAVKALRGSALSFILCLAVLFLNGTNLEQACVYQGIAAFLAMLFFLRRDKKKAAMSCAFWLASVAGFCVMYFAPGTSVRMSALNAVKESVITQLLRGFVSAFSLGVYNAVYFFAKPLVWSVVFFLPVFAENIPPADERLSRRLRVRHILAVILVISMFMQYMMGVISGGGLPVRGVSLSLWLMGFTWVMLWVFVYRGKLLRYSAFLSKLRWPVLVLSVLVSANFTECVSAFRTAPDFAAEWEARVALMHSQAEQGVKELQVPPLKTKTELIFADIDPLADWAGPGFARYYGGENVHLVPEGLSGNPEDVAKLLSGDLSPYAKLAEKGSTEAMRIMGAYTNPRTLYKGERPVNAEESLRWYKTGTDAGDVRCMKALPRLLLKHSFLEALYWQVKYYVLTIRL